jgi:hypothetical protein
MALSYPESRSRSTREADEPASRAFSATHGPKAETTGLVSSRSLVNRRVVRDWRTAENVRTLHSEPIVAETFVVFLVSPGFTVAVPCA